MDSCAIDPQSFKDAIVKLIVILHLPNTFRRAATATITVVYAVAAVVAVVVVAAAAAVVAAAAAVVAAAVGLLAPRVFRGHGRQPLGENHQEVALCRVHGDHPARGRDRDLHRFQGSRQGRTF